MAGGWPSSRQRSSHFTSFFALRLDALFCMPSAGAPPFFLFFQHASQKASGKRTPGDQAQTIVADKPGSPRLQSRGSQDCNALLGNKAQRPPVHRLLVERRNIPSGEVG